MKTIDRVVKYPQVVAAYKNLNQSLWKVGDALLAECGPPSTQGVKDGSLVALREAAK
jgi:hypothetical protein